MTLRAAPQRFDTANPHVGVSIAVFREGRVLLTTRTQPPFVGMFTLPGGHIELGETASYAALRELQEETGIKAKLVGFNQYVETVTPPNASGISRHFVILSFVGIWTFGQRLARPRGRRNSVGRPEADRPTKDIALSHRSRRERAENFSLQNLAGLIPWSNERP